jgi:hypothetical protein
MVTQTAVRLSGTSGTQPPVVNDLPRWIPIVYGAYLEIPALHLTRSQVQRLWDLDAGSCDGVLGTLLEWGFLERATDGAFVRATRLQSPSLMRS